LTKEGEARRAGTRTKRVVSSLYTRNANPQWSERGRELYLKVFKKRWPVMTRKKGGKNPEEKSLMGQRRRRESK